jgi:toxin ParE1/3/4
MSTAIYAPAADEDLLGIATYIAQDSPRAARKWLHTVRETCDLLAANPQMGEERPGFGVPGCRCFSVGNYVVFFRPIEGGGIEVARIVHGSRDLRNL